MVIICPIDKIKLPIVYIVKPIDRAIPKWVTVMIALVHDEIANLKVAGWWYVLHAYIL
jgi:hypothetical protein